MKKFGVNKSLIKKTIIDGAYETKTKYGAYVNLFALNGYTLRVVYAKLYSAYKVITFHIAKKGRYESKVL